MTDMPRILHLVDDATPGGITRVLDHIRSCPLMAQTARHELWTVARNAALPRCDADMIVSHLSLSWRGLPALISLRARHPGTPLVHVEHSYTEAFTALNVRAKLRFFTMLRTAYALFDRVVAVSEAQGAWLTRRRLVPAGALRVIPPVVDLAGFRALPAPQGAPRVIGAIGRLHRQKGFDILIQAFRQLPDAGLALHIHGSGPEEAALRALAEGDPRIRFFGHSGQPEKVMASVDLVAMPSRWEAFGLVALEARSAGRPVLCPRLDGLATSAGADGLFVTGHGIDAWARALQRALAATDSTPDRAAGCEAVFAEGWAELIASCCGHAKRAPQSAGAGAAPGTLIAAGLS
ncbi:glycosyltransferase [Salipiger abyssi]|uniref:Glycosyltransferase n=1 Tax=Salipiger abyssi TaxID=1250539 RepID=A0A1P8US36_9RHOB|nr:glycosyltransferase [Salipiger abyssi]APZ52187.1 glycosyltransferase [Salipiger abyssi]